LLTLRSAVADCPLRVVAVVVRLALSDDRLVVVDPLVRGPDQLPPLPDGFRFTLLTDPRDRPPPPPPLRWA
jgi:hypothetical protein